MDYPIDIQYYIKRKPELLARFDGEVKVYGPLVLKQYGEIQSYRILIHASIEFESLIPQIPYIGGDENPGTRWLLASVRCLAFYKAMKKYGKTAAEAGKILYDAILTQVGKPQQGMPTQEQLSEQYRKAAERSQERRYPEDYVFEYVPGDGREFDRGADFIECAAHKFYRAQGADEFMPFYCYLDFPKSKVLGNRFSRTMTLAEGYNKCDHRTKIGGDTKCVWPPPFLKRK